ncbi:hypothetical protein [Paenibacillus lautus]|nr:hypothetical protein [Paenibacillus lautus]
MKIDLHTHAKLSKASDFSKNYYEEMIREAGNPPSPGRVYGEGRLHPFR